MKRGITILILLLMVTLPFVIGLPGPLREIVGGDRPLLAPQEAAVTVGNEAPTVITTSADNVGEVTPDDIFLLLNPASTTPIEIIFVVTDNNGVSTLVGSTLVITLTGGGNTRSTTGDTACTSVDDTVTQRTYKCNVNQQFYDDDVAWNAAVSIADSGGLTGSDTVHGYTIGNFKAISLAPAGGILFGTIAPGATNTESILPNTEVTNEGNHDVLPTGGQGSLFYTSELLRGETDGTQSISGNEFRAVTTSDIVSPNTACTVTIGADLLQGVAVAIPNINLPRGTDAVPLSTEDTRHCLKGGVPTLAQVYSTGLLGGNNPWKITI